MKNLLYILLACTFFACSDSESEKKFDINVFPQKWKLVEMSGNIPNSTTTGADMGWQETYVLNADGTFLKSRVRDGVTTEASGTYTLQTLSANENHLVLTYPTYSELIGSCTSRSGESLWMQTSTSMISSWAQCDGPGLKYERAD